MSLIGDKRRFQHFSNMDIGKCTSLWTPSYLNEKLSDIPAKVHVTTNDKMDFLSKNFIYRTLPFTVLISRAASCCRHENAFTEHGLGLRQDGDVSQKDPPWFLAEDEKYYFRSLGQDVRGSVADFWTQYPSIASDFVLPASAGFFSADQYFSSVLRVSSPGVQIWTHFDVMDNVLCQIVGRKRVVLFPPSDIGYMYLDGDKSRVIDIDHPDLDRFPLFAQADRFEVTLDPGDILYIPALWFHNITALDFSVGVNVFWRGSLDRRLYDTKDLYGNADPLPVQRSMQVLGRLVQCLNQLPEEGGFRSFYAHVVANKLVAKCAARPGPTSSGSSATAAACTDVTSGATTSTNTPTSLNTNTTVNAPKTN